MTKYTWFFLVLVIFLSISYFAPQVGIGVEGRLQVAHLNEHAISVLEENGYEVPDSAKTGIVEVESSNPEKMFHFLWNCISFNVDDVPPWLATIIWALILVMVMIAVTMVTPIISAIIQAAGSALRMGIPIRR